jgi:hypothetical protein
MYPYLSDRPAYDPNLRRLFTFSYAPLYPKVIAILVD